MGEIRMFPLPRPCPFGHKDLLPRTIVLHSVLFYYAAGSVLSCDIDSAAGEVWGHNYLEWETASASRGWRRKQILF